MSLHSTATRVRVRSLQRDLVVEQAQPATAGPRPLRLDAGERNRQMLLRGIVRILRLRTSIVSDEVAFFAGGPARRRLPQLVVLPAQGIYVDSHDRICQTRRRRALGRMASLIDYSERRMRAAIAAAPDGVYHGEDVIDNDWVGGGPVHVRVAVTIDGDEVAIDFDGTSDQVGSNMNAPFVSTVAAAFGCVKAALTSADIPCNAGSTRPATVTAPYGSLLNAAPIVAEHSTIEWTDHTFNPWGAARRSLPDGHSGNWRAG